MGSLKEILVMTMSFGQKLQDNIFYHMCICIYLFIYNRWHSNKAIYIKRAIKSEEEGLSILKSSNLTVSGYAEWIYTFF